ncbi:MAG: hypothetical protein ACXW13_01380 [Burkholderiaceae bacterium]
MTKMRLAALFTTMTLLVIGPARADPIDEAYHNFNAGRYDVAFRDLLAYRINHEGTLRVDFMLAVSACRLSGEHKALGGFLLSAIADWYSPLRPDHLQDIRRQAEVCPSTGISEQAAFSFLQGKADGPDTRLSGDRSSSGKNEPLPAAPLPAHPKMGPLVKGVAYLQADYANALVTSAAQCSKLCGDAKPCVAMTFVVSQKRCWLKDKVPARSAHPDMISAVKVQQ